MGEHSSQHSKITVNNTPAVEATEDIHPSCVTADNVEPPGSGSIAGSGSGSGSGSGGGGGLSGASCVQAGFATCCVGTEAECTVGPSPIECSCSRDCYFSQTTTCCHDITEVPCFPGTVLALSSRPILPALQCCMLKS